MHFESPLGHHGQGSRGPRFPRVYFLRILARYELKMSKNEDSVDILLDNFVNKLFFKNLYVLFFKNGP